MVQLPWNLSQPPDVCHKSSHIIKNNKQCLNDTTNCSEKYESLAIWKEIASCEDSICSLDYEKDGIFDGALFGKGKANTPPKMRSKEQVDPRLVRDTRTEYDN